MTSSTRQPVAALDKPLALVGFSGAGKSTVGQLVATALNVPLVDTDAEIERRAGRSIAALFAEGEAVFRRVEAEVCLDALNKRPRVIATGGGALLDERVREAYLARAHVMLLRISEETAWRRLANKDDRPLLDAGRTALSALYAQRVPFYGLFADSVDANSDVPETVANRVMARLSAGLSIERR